MLPVWGKAGNVYLPGAPNVKHTDYDPSRTPLWLRGLVDECASFPNAAHDDQVDALSQALMRMSALSGLCPPRAPGARRFARELRDLRDQRQSLWTGRPALNWPRGRAVHQVADSLEERALVALLRAPRRCRARRVGLVDHSAIGLREP